MGGGTTIVSVALQKFSDRLSMIERTMGAKGAKSAKHDIAPHPPIPPTSPQPAQQSPKSSKLRRPSTGPGSSMRTPLDSGEAIALVRCDPPGTVSLPPAV